MPLPDLTPQDKQTLERVQKRYDSAEPEHKKQRTRWDHFNALYHNYRDWRRSWSDASANDVDAVMRDGQREFGDELFIPFTFTIIETIVPRMMSNNPRMLWEPQDDASGANTEAHRQLMNQQQSRAGYTLSLQTTAKTGQKLGLGVRKTYWRQEKRTRRRLAKGVHGDWVVDTQTGALVYDDPWSEDVDPYLFRCDPLADSADTWTWTLQQSFRSTEYVWAKIQAGAWSRVAAEPAPAPDVYGVALADIEQLRSTDKYDDLWKGRKQALGQDSAAPPEGRDIHEILEFHDGDRVITVLDRALVVSDIENPYWHGEIPFSVYRPTEIEHRMCGKSAIEPIEDLQWEFNELRTQRRDNARLKLQMAFAYNDGSVDPLDIQFGPAQLIPTNGDPAGLLQPLQVGDIPNSSFAEEDRLIADIERTSGVSDQTSGAASAATTATGAQLVQAAANVRIQNMTFRLEQETVKREARQWVELNQQHILAPRTVKMPAVPSPENPAGVAFAQVGPEELAGSWDLEPEGGASAPDNVPQMRQDATFLESLLQAPQVDSAKLLPKIMQLFGLKHPEQYLAPSQHVPPATLDLIKQELVQQGFDPAKVQAMMQGALDAAAQQEQQAQGAPPLAGGQGPQSGQQDQGPPADQAAQGQPEPKPAA